jgi:hypothetical protein
VAPRLSPDTEALVERLFSPGDRAEAARLLDEECGNNLPFLGKLDDVGLERFRFAALKLSRGNLADLRDTIELAKVDWRDLLVAAGFGTDLQAHRSWLRSVVRK